MQNTLQRQHGEKYKIYRCLDEGIKVPYVRQIFLDKRNGETEREFVTRDVL